MSEESKTPPPETHVVWQEEAIKEVETLFSEMDAVLRGAQEPPQPNLIGCEDGDIPCDRCSGTGNLIKDWDRYISAKTTEEIEDCESDCPDCSGYGRLKAETPAPVSREVSP